MAREGFVEKHVGMTALRSCHPEIVDMALLSLAMPPVANEPSSLTLWSIGGKILY